MVFRCAAQRSEPEEIKDEDKQTYAGVSINEDRSWATSQEKNAGETKDDHSRDKVDDLEGRESESVMEGQRGGETHSDEASGSGESARNNIEKTRSEIKAGKHRSPQAGAQPHPKFHASPHVLVFCALIMPSFLLV